MKKISLVQVNFQQGPEELNAFYLPYSVGLLWSYVSQFKSVTEKYCLDEFIWRRDPMEISVNAIKNSDVLGISVYVWNKNYSYTIAKKYKEINPNGIVIMGGPEPAINKDSIIEELPFVDIIVKQEGETNFKKILESDCDFNILKSVPGLLLNINGTKFDTGASIRIKNLEEIPSPYLTGVFDKLMSKHPEVEWNMTLETDRGCPYQCTFCDWGSLTYSKVKKYKLERVFDELEWAGKNKIGFISMTNANFGIFPERDSLIADKIIETQKVYGWPKTFNTAWAKNQKKEVVDIVKKLVHSPYGKNQGLTVSVQSMDLSVLENIKRKNLGINQIKEVFELCNKSNVPLYTETILGLPGETLDTWKYTYYKLFDAGNHTGITTFQLQVLENTELNLLQKDQFNIKTSAVYDYMAGSHAEKEILESIDIVISTDTLPDELMLDAQIFSWFIMTFHINGITSWISQLLNKKYNIHYYEFYEKFWNFIKADEWFQQEIIDTRMYYKNWMKNGKANHPKVGNISISGYTLIYRTVINIHNQNMYDYVFNLIKNFLNSFEIDKGILEEILLFQKNYFINYNDIKNYEKNISFNYDFLGYLRDNERLEVPVTYSFDFDEDKNVSFSRFLDSIFYQRRRNYGKAVIKIIQRPVSSVG